MPVRFATTIATPVSINGTLKSTTASRSEFMIRDVKTYVVEIINGRIIFKQYQ